MLTQGDFFVKKAYALVLFGTCLSALGPSVFMAMLNIEQMNCELGISLFLLMGGLSIVVIYLIDNFANHSNKKRAKLGPQEIIKPIHLEHNQNEQITNHTSGGFLF